MNKEVIAKLGLVESEREYYNTAANGIPVYTDTRGHFFAGCDLLGNPGPEWQYLLFDSSNRTAYVTKEFLLQVDNKVLQVAFKGLMS